jgi:hypothetical protein
VGKPVVFCYVMGLKGHTSYNSLSKDGSLKPVNRSTWVAKKMHFTVNPMKDGFLTHLKTCETAKIPYFFLTPNHYGVK